MNKILWKILRTVLEVLGVVVVLVVGFCWCPILNALSEAVAADPSCVVRWGVVFILTVWLLALALQDLITERARQ